MLLDRRFARRYPLGDDRNAVPGLCVEPEIVFGDLIQRFVRLALDLDIRYVVAEIVLDDDPRTVTSGIMHICEDQISASLPILGIAVLFQVAVQVFDQPAEFGGLAGDLFAHLGGDLPESFFGEFSLCFLPVQVIHTAKCSLSAQKPKGTV